MTVGRATVVSCRRQRGESHKRTSNLDQEHNSAEAEHASPSNRNKSSALHHSFRSDVNQCGYHLEIRALHGSPWEFDRESSG